MTNIDYLPCVEIETEPDAPATASLIGLHGLGADGHDLAHLASSLPIQQPVRWRFPHAPVRPVSLHGGVRCLPGTTFMAWTSAVRKTRRDLKRRPKASSGRFSGKSTEVSQASASFCAAFL